MSIVEPLIIGLVGVILMLTGFFLNLFKWIKVNSKAYIVLNIVGAGLATYYSILVNVIPFVIFEGIWTIVAIYQFIIIFILKKIK